LYCIVFSTEKLIDLLSRERISHSWLRLNVSRILYNPADITVDQDYCELIEACKQAYFRYITEDKVAFPDEGPKMLISVAPRFKHIGFREEQEVRIIAIPAKQSVVDMMRLERPDETVAPAKVIHSRASTEGECPYLALFDCLGATLPIKRIIVGPSRNQDQNLAAARHLIKNKFPLSRSLTPFIG
jgi:hypothetical protein